MIVIGNADDNPVEIKIKAWTLDLICKNTDGTGCSRLLRANANDISGTGFINSLGCLLILHSTGNSLGWVRF